MPSFSSQAHRGTLAFLPTFHVIGFTNNFLYNLTVGAQLNLHEDAASAPLNSSLPFRG